MTTRGLCRCSRGDGVACMAYADGFCIALDNTKFNRPCPFFNDRTTKSEEYIEWYEDRFKGKNDSSKTAPSVRAVEKAKKEGKNIMLL